MISETMPFSQQPEPHFAGKRRIVLTTVGWLGDLPPYIAIALGLKARVDVMTVAASNA
jgi:hypothetical protein